MDRSYWHELMEKTAFPAEAVDFLDRAGETLAAQGQEEAFDALTAAYAAGGFHAEAVAPQVESVAKAAGLSPYTVWFFLLAESSKPVREDFAAKGIPEEIFWDTFSDLRAKINECKEVQGVWGNFVAFWYDIFFTGHIVKLGRMEYETAVNEWQDATLRGVSIPKGSVVRSIHIPASGEPFDRETRLASYRKAYEFFKPELGGGPLVCVCHSWLLYPPYREILSPTSNIVDFMDDFDIIGQDEDKEFGDCWRLFGRDYQKPTADLPERTSMQRAFKQYLLGGGVPGAGRGVLLFDGEKLLTGKKR